MINGVGWLDDCHSLSPILYETAPLFVYTDQLLCHRVSTCSTCFHFANGWFTAYDGFMMLLLVGWVICNNKPNQTTLKSTSVSVCFRGISRVPSAFVFLRWFKLAHISIQVCTLHDGCKQGIDQQIFNRKSISRKISLNKDWGGVILREIDFLLKICWSISCLHPSWKVNTQTKLFLPRAAHCLSAPQAQKRECSHRKSALKATASPGDEHCVVKRKTLSWKQRIERKPSVRPATQLLQHHRNKRRLQYAHIFHQTSNYVLKCDNKTYCFSYAV